MASLRCLRELSRRTTTVLSINQTRALSSFRGIESSGTSITHGSVSQNQSLTRDFPWYRLCYRSQGHRFASKRSDSDKGEKSSEEAVRKTLSKDQTEDVREMSYVEANCEDVGEVKETSSVKEVSAIVLVNGVEGNREVESSLCLTTSSDLSMMKPSLSASRGLSLVSIPCKQEQRSDSRVVNRLSVSPGPRTPAHDGYNWRKYGQKQVKSPKGSRSYYRCTHSACCAKKIECSNDSGNVVEIINKGLHSHEPPRNINNGVVLEEVAIVPSGSEPSASTRKNICKSPKIIERKRHSENEAVEEPDPKRRPKKDSSQSSDSVSKPGKENKSVVPAAGDGYRWRKYGQKMVKGILVRGTITDVHLRDVLSVNTFRQQSRTQQLS